MANTWLKLKKYSPNLLIANTDLTVSITFKYYSMDKDDILYQGFYAMTKVFNKSENDDDT